MAHLNNVGTYVGHHDAKVLVYATFVSKLKIFISVLAGFDDGFYHGHVVCNYDVVVEYFCASVVHHITGETITQYRKLKDDPANKKIWNKAFSKEIGNDTRR